MRSPSQKSLSSRASSASSTGCLRLFFALFFLVGIGLFGLLSVWPAMHVFAARSWKKTPCVIDSSRLSRSSGKSTTYGIEITYHYYHQDRPFTSNRYSFSVGKTSGRVSKEAVVQRYPPGTETSCYVNPEAPEQAVIDRGWQGDFAFGLIGLVFAVPGMLGLFFAGRVARSRQATPDGLPLAGPSSSDGPAVLKPSSTPLRKFVGILVFALIWNGFVGLFVYFVFFDKSAPLFAKAIVSLLALIGVACVAGVFTSFLALFNPRVRLSAPTTRVPLGGELSFSWTVTGRSGMLRKLRIVFEGREEATYKRGTRTSTDTCVFAEIPVFETSEREFLTQGSARVAVPATLMHTFEGGHNKVLWRLKVSGEIPRWPDVADEYPIVVLPLPLAG